MQGHERMRQLRQNLRSEMQPGRRRGDGAGHFRKDRLITLDVARIAGPPDVGRKWNRPSLKEILFAVERDHSLALRADFFDARRRAVNFRPGANPHFAARFDQAFPTRRPELFEEKKFDLAVVGKSPGAHHARVVQDQQVARSQKFAQLGELAVFDSLVAPVQHHHPGFVPMRERPLRDQLFRQRVIVVRELRTHS